MSEFPNFRAGLFGRGVAPIPLLFGGRTESTIGSQSQEFYTVSAPTNMTQNLVRRMITVNDILYTYSDVDRSCYKIICSDTLLVSADINCNGGSVWASTYSSPGFLDGQIGGSGSSTASSATQAVDAGPVEGNQLSARWLGGSGGNGGVEGGGYVGAEGGVVVPVANFFDPSVSLDGVTYATFAYGEDPMNGVLFPWFVRGGCGGGGCSGKSASPGGGGGSGGGVIYIAANKIIMDGGHITANGQSTGAGTGGGGGGGGAVIIVCNELSWTVNGGAIEAAGGSGGDLGAGDGDNGNILIFNNEMTCLFDGGTVTPASYLAAKIKAQSKGMNFVGAY